MTKAVGVVRVSVTGERDPTALRSPGEQRQRIAEWCEREGFPLLAVHEEIDVSGGKPLVQRPGLSQAVEAVERGEAGVVAVAYFDRLVRSLVVQAEVVQRVEAAGGRVVAVDFGDVSEATAAQWASATAIGMAAEFYRRSIRERVAAAEARMIEQGISPHKPPPGLVRDEGRRFVPGPDAPVVQEAFAMRARGETFKSIRSYLREHGIVRSYNGVQQMLRNRTYIGEVRRGGNVNPQSHEPLIDRDTWAAVQRARVSKGRQPKSKLLLARLRLLRCGSCGGPMVSGTQTQRGKKYPMYRCSEDGKNCDRPVYIAAGRAEAVVVEAVKRLYSEARGRASASEDAREAEAAAERAQADLDAAIRAFGGLEDEAAAQTRLAELREARDQAVALADQLRHRQSALTISLEDWDRLTLDEQRAVLSASGIRAVVRPGRGRDRIEILSEDPPGGAV